MPKLKRPTDEHGLLEVCVPCASHVKMGEERRESQKSVASEDRVCEKSPKIVS